MLKLINYSLSKDIEYYIPCSLPFINAKLEYSGYESRLSLLLSTRLAGIPHFIKNTNTKEIKLQSIGSSAMNYKNYTEYLNIRIEWKTFETFEVGM